MHVEEYLNNNFKSYKNLNWQGEEFHYFEIEEFPDTRVLMTKGLSDFKINFSILFKQSTPPSPWSKSTYRR